MQSRYSNPVLKPCDLGLIRVWYENRLRKPANCLFCYENSIGQTRDSYYLSYRYDDHLLTNRPSPWMTSFRYRSRLRSLISNHVTPSPRTYLLLILIPFDTNWHAPRLPTWHHKVLSRAHITIKAFHHLSHYLCLHGSLFYSSIDNSLSFTFLLVLANLSYITSLPGYSSCFLFSESFTVRVFHSLCSPSSSCY